MKQKELVQLAEDLVEAWHSVKMGPENPFGSRERALALLDDRVDNLKKLRFCGTKFKLRDNVHGSPIMLNHGNEIAFANLAFARVVKNVLRAKRYYRNGEILRAIL